jgi:alpha-mannosidase
VRIVRKTEKSVITQDVTMYAHSPRVDFVTHVDWHETRVLLKAAFPVDVRSTTATYEIAFGAIERATHHNTAWDRARYEVVGHRWADLSEGDYGVRVLNDCKYGHDTKNNVLRLSLLRSPIDPDPKADQGEHEFVYSLYPHGGDWRCGTVQEAHELNNPMVAVAAKASAGELAAVDAFASVDADNVIIDTVKRHEDSDAIIVRLYEAYGQRGDVAITFGRTPKKVAECDLMEENDTPVKVKGATVQLRVTPYEIRTLKVVF